MRSPQSAKRFNLNRRMADHIKQLLMPPNIGFKWGDIEITSQNRWVSQCSCPLRHPPDKIELLPEFAILLPVGNVAACWYVDIVQPNAIGQPGADMPSLAIILPVMLDDISQWNPADNGDTVVHLLAIEDDMWIAASLKLSERKHAILGLGFLQAQNVG